MPIENIPIFLIGYGLVMFCAYLAWQDYKEKRHEKMAKRVRSYERRRYINYLIVQGQRSRIERAKTYHH